MPGDQPPAGCDRFDFVRSYEGHTAQLVETEEDQEAALDRSTGSVSSEEFSVIGELQRDLLLAYGLEEDSFVVEIGCGSGRLAVQLAGWLRGTYVGTDVVQALVDRAAAVADGPHMRFERVAGLTVPVDDGTADLVCAFSVFTHLLHEESYAYLQDCRRVLKQGGRVVFSFLEYRVPSHWAVMEANLRSLGRHEVLNQFVSVDAVEAWAAHLGFEVANVFRGDRPYIPLTRPVLLNGHLYRHLGTFGQSAAVLVKP